MLGQHIEKCAEQADNREPDVFFFQFRCFICCSDYFGSQTCLMHANFEVKQLIAISVLANPCRTFTVQMCSVLQMVFFTKAYTTLH